MDLPAGTAARLCSTSPPCRFEVQSHQGLDAARVVRVDVAAGSRWSARLLDLSSVQAWKAATSCAWLIRPF